MLKNKLIVSGSPHDHCGDSVQKIMFRVILALMPAFLVAIYYFGLPAIVITLVAIGSCLGFEYLIQRFMLKEKSYISDGSAILTGLLLAFNLPSNMPIIWVIVGSFVAIVIGKMAFGGLGKNPFNPALVGRAFLLIARPVEMATWPTPQPIWGFTDAITGPTPLGLLKEKAKAGEVDMLMNVDGMPDYLDLLMGQMGGSFGEVSAIALLIGGVYLLVRRVITWHIPVAYILSAFILAGILHLVDPTHYVTPLFHIVTGGLILGAFFMATDMVTSPTTAKGQLIFGCGCGVLTILIRVFGAYPEGASFAILLMNAVTPLINKISNPKAFGKA